MNNAKSQNRPLSIHNWVAVIISAVVGAVLGIAFGLFGNLPAWIIAGTVFGTLLGLANQVLLPRIRRLTKWYRLGSVLLITGEILLTIYVGYPARIAYWVTHPVRVPIVGSPADVGSDYQDVVIPTTDGIVLRGWYVPSHNGAAIIALHGYNSNRVVLLPYADALAEHGYGVLMLDLRAHGESDGKVFPFADPSQDVGAAITYLRKRPDVDPEHIGALGRSIGGHAIIRAAAQDGTIKALLVDGVNMNTLDDLFLLSPSEIGIPASSSWLVKPGYWVYDRMKEWMSGGMPLESNKVLVSRIAPRPIFFVSKAKDQEQGLNRLYCSLAGPNAQLWEVPGAEHCTGILTHANEYEQRMLAFFDAALLPQ